MSKKFSQRGKRHSDKIPGGTLLLRLDANISLLILVEVCAFSSHLRTNLSHYRPSRAFRAPGV